MAKHYWLLASAQAEQRHVLPFHLSLVACNRRSMHTCIEYLTFFQRKRRDDQSQSSATSLDREMSSEFIISEDSARLGYGSRLSSQRFDSSRFDSFIDYTNEDHHEGGLEEYLDTSPHGGGYVAAPPPAEVVVSEAGEFAAKGPTLPPPAEKGFALGEWRRQNAIRLEEKERKEKETLKAIIEEADEYKAEFYRKWKIKRENSKALSREREKKFLEGREKFHAEADKSFWKAIAELIPREVPLMENKEKKPPTIVVIQGPKAGRPTDLSRMRHLLVKLKHEPPVHMIKRPPQQPEKTTPVALPSTSPEQGVFAFVE
ncbi:clathrin light chain 2-like [Salvia miltiorrhiza]|uniref:clathrin light chain 2-like n=1 Tax=Salvia miltiorrhiza TaxID=226208 RepID=UPI0025ACF77A|nr:clathrin light chain 2-like [Salvia miltiorrhiza]